MYRIINLFISFISKTHAKILTLNDAYGLAISDKWLHFIIIGMFGFGLLLIIQPIFKWLASHDGTLLITFIYVFTVIIVVTLAIEIGQAWSGTGDMDKYDVMSGIAGFFVAFGVYLVGYLVYKETKSNTKNIENNQENDEKKTKK